MQNYWKNRYSQIEASANKRGRRYNAALEKKYLQAEKVIEEKITKWYNRLAENNGVEDARQFLSKSELKEFKWTVEEYIAKGKENAIDQRWMKELENASARVHIRKLEALKLECRHQIELTMHGHQLDLFEDLAETYKDSYYMSAYTIQKGVGLKVAIGGLNDVDKILSKPWAADGKDFSSRIWEHRTKLVNTLDRELSSMVLTGTPVNKTIRAVAQTMKASLNNSKRLVYTEHAFFCTEGERASYTALGLDEFEFICTLDDKTCERCAALDGTHYPTSSMEVGVNAPPMHPNCRCTTAPYFEDNGGGKRVSMEKGKIVYNFDQNITYNDWRQQVENND